MSLSFLSWVLPLDYLLKTARCENPDTYVSLDEMPPSHRSAEVCAIVERVLNAENVPNSQYYSRITEMLKPLPEPKTINALLQHRLRVIDRNTVRYAEAGGTDRGKYYIALAPTSEGEELPFVITHELSHILNSDRLFKDLLKTIVDIAAIAITTFVLGWSGIGVLTGVLATDFVVGAILSHQREMAADDFAIKHCTREQLEKGIAFFKKVKVQNSQCGFLVQVRQFFRHPSPDSRIANVEKRLRLIS
jgi:hypothetical protein